MMGRDIGNRKQGGQSTRPRSGQAVLIHVDSLTIFALSAIRIRTSQPGMTRSRSLHTQTQTVGRKGNKSGGGVL